MAVFLVVLHRSGPAWQASLPSEGQTGWPEHAAFMEALVDSGFVVMGGPLHDERRVVLVVEADSDNDVRDVLGQDPWSWSHLVLVSLEPWPIQLDGRTRSR